jgi:hypothetical protein
MGLHPKLIEIFESVLFEDEEEEVKKEKKSNKTNKTKKKAPPKKTKKKEVDGIELNTYVNRNSPDNFNGSVILLDFPTILRDVCSTKPKQTSGVTLTDNIIDGCRETTESFVKAFPKADVLYLVFEKGYNPAKADTNAARVAKNLGYTVNDNITFDMKTGTFFFGGVAGPVDFSKVMNTQIPGIKKGFCYYVVTGLIKSFSLCPMAERPNLVVHFDYRDVKIEEANKRNKENKETKENKDVEPNILAIVGPGKQKNEGKPNQFHEAEHAIVHHMESHVGKHIVVYSIDGDCFPLILTFLSKHPDTKVNWYRKKGAKGNWPVHSCFKALQSTAMNPFVSSLWCILCGNDYFIRGTNEYFPFNGIGPDFILYALIHMSLAGFINQIPTNYDMFQVLVRYVYYYKCLPYVNKKKIKTNYGKSLTQEGLTIVLRKFNLTKTNVLTFPSDSIINKGFKRFQISCAQWNIQ